MNTATPVGALPPGTMTDRLLRITPLVDLLGLRIEGELDRITLPALTRALDSMAGRGGFCVDMSGMGFIDVGGLRALVTAATGLPGGHVLTLRSPSSQVRRMLDLTGWHKTAGLRLQAPWRAPPAPPRPGP